MLAIDRAPEPEADAVAPLVIIADDLTGALDAAAPFATQAARPAVATRVEGFAAALATGCTVIAVSTRSREADGATAAARLRAVLAQLPPHARLFKKIDSRLKGPIAEELAALGRDDLVILPAVPAFGRNVQGGMLQGFGVDVPVDVRRRVGSATALIPDTADDGAMDAAVAAALEAGAVIVGARGASASLARRAGIVPAAARPLELPVAVVVGSRDPITGAQVAALEAALAGPLAADGRIVLFKADAAERSAEAIAATLAAAVTSCAKTLRSLVLTGGATAEAVLDALEVDLLALEGEMQPGIPVARAGALRIVTKSGGFGAADALVRLVAEGAT